MNNYGEYLLRCKKTVFTLLPWLGRSLAFNRFSRDLWMLEKSRGIPVDSRLIDIGAGSCPYRELFAHCSYVAHDFGMLEQDQIQDQQGYGNIDIYSDITAIPVEDESFDVVVCTEVLEHVPEPIRAVEEMARILKPGGRLLLTAPLRSALHQEPYHYYGGFTPYWFSHFLGKAGFEEISVIPVCGIFNFYGEESLRIFLALSPFGSATVVVKFLLFPLWMITMPWFALLCPIGCSVLDRMKIDIGNTTGYRVEAKKRLD